MDDQSPTKRFTFHADPNQAPIRDKDNAHPQLKPAFAKRPAPNIAPPGCVGIRRRPANDSPEFDL